MWVVIALLEGIVEEVRVSDEEDVALAWRDELDREYDIERKADGTYENYTNDVFMRPADQVKLASQSPST